MHNIQNAIKNKCAPILIGHSYGCHIIYRFLLDNVNVEIIKKMDHIIFINSAMKGLHLNSYIPYIYKICQPLVFSSAIIISKLFGIVPQQGLFYSDYKIEKTILADIHTYDDKFEEVLIRILNVHHIKLLNIQSRVTLYDHYTLCYVFSTSCEIPSFEAYNWHIYKVKLAYNM